MNAVIWVTLPACYFRFRLFLSWIGRGWGGGVRCFCLGISEEACIKSIPGSGRATTFFAKKFENTPAHPLPPPNKKRTFPNMLMHDWTRDSESIGSPVAFGLNERYIFLSSAQKWKAPSCLIMSSRGAVYIEYRIGPSTEPCRTP